MRYRGMVWLLCGLTASSAPSLTLSQTASAQVSYGACSPNISNVKGNVVLTMVCEGRITPEQQAKIANDVANALRAQQTVSKDKLRDLIRSELTGAMQRYVAAGTISARTGNLFIDVVTRQGETDMRKLLFKQKFDGLVFRGTLVDRAGTVRISNEVKDSLRTLSRALLELKPEIVLIEAYVPKGCPERIKRNCPERYQESPSEAYSLALSERLASYVKDWMATSSDLNLSTRILYEGHGQAGEYPAPTTATAAQWTAAADSNHKVTVEIHI